MPITDRHVAVSNDRFLVFTRDGARHEMIASTVRWSASTKPAGDDLVDPVNDDLFEIEISVEFPLDRSMTYEAIETEAFSRVCRAIRELVAETPESLAQKLKATDER